MSFLSFKNLTNIKLFKIHLKSPKKEPETIRKLSLKEVFYCVLIGFISVLILSYLLTYLPSRSLPELKVGEIASQDITAPINMTIQDKEGTERRRKEAINSVLPVYYIDSSVVQNAINDIKNLFKYGRDEILPLVNSNRRQKFEKIARDIEEKFNIELTPNEIKELIHLKFDSALEEELINIIKKVSSKGIILTKDMFDMGEEERGLVLVFKPGREKNVKVDELLEYEQSKKVASLEVDFLNLKPEEKRILKSLTYLFLSPNVKYNRVETETRKTIAASKTEPVYYNLKKGKIIIRKGDEVSSETVKLIKAINLNLKSEENWLVNLSGIFLLFGFLFIALWFYLKSTLPFKEFVSRFLMFGPILVLSLIFYKFFFFLSNLISQNTNIPPFNLVEAYRFVHPFQVGAFLFAFLTSSHLALLYSILNSLVAGYLFKGSYELMIFAFITCLASIYGIKYYQSRKKASIFKAGLFVVVPTNIFIITTLNFIAGRSVFTNLYFGEILMSLIGALIASALATSLFPLFENLYGLLTDVKLLELCNLDLPIFRQMALEAPGTYHHSLIVASLAEEAANSLKLNPLLLRACALYHDIGKLKRPGYYIENQTSNPSLHEELTPRMSTLVIINHVKEGLEKANKLKLPSKIKEIIQQHHGTSLMRYFYYKAKKTYDPEMQKVGEEVYRYPGPKPESKEAVIIMLADSVEAASRSLKSPTPENLKKVVKDIFDNYLADGQFDESDITFKDLVLVASSFVKTLNRVYHSRIEYPGFEFEKSSNKKKRPKSES
jgi:hypothetical protein